MASNIIKNAATKLRCFSVLNRPLNAPRTTAGPPYRHYYSNKPGDNNKEPKAPLPPHPIHPDLLEFVGDEKLGWRMSDAGDRMVVFVTMPGYGRGDFDIKAKDNTIFVIGKDHEQPELSFGAVVKLPTGCAYDFSKLIFMVQFGILAINVPKMRV